MTNETQNPRRGDRGYTMEESLEALKKLNPVSPSDVNGECSACCHFRQVYKGRRIRTFCRFSGETVFPCGNCKFWKEGGEPC